MKFRELNSQRMKMEVLEKSADFQCQSIDWQMSNESQNCSVGGFKVILWCHMVKMEKKKIKMWNMDEELKFIDVWKENINDLRKAKRNKHVYENMARALAQQGVYVMSCELQRKVNNFSQKYRKEKNLMGCSGGSPSKWVHYQSVHSIIGSFASNDSGKIHESIEWDSFSCSTPTPPEHNETFLIEEMELPSALSSPGYVSPEPPGASSPPLLSSSLPSPPPLAETPPPLTSPGPSSSGRSSSSSARRRHATINERMLQAMKRTNELLERDINETTALARETQNIEREWMGLMKKFFDKI